MECLYCHSQIPVGASFCQNCGARVEIISKSIIQENEYPKKQISSSCYDNRPHKVKKSNCSTLILIVFIIAVIFVYNYFTDKNNPDNKVNNEPKIVQKNNDENINIDNE